MARLAAGAVVLLLSATGAARARGAGTERWLQWPSLPGADACLGADLFASKVERSLGRSPAAAANDAHVTVAARIERVGSRAPGTPPRWWGEIWVRGTDDGGVHGSRSLSRDGVSCEPLADALAFATALVLSDDATESPPLRAPGVVGAREAARASGPTPEATPRMVSERPPGQPDREAARGRAMLVESARAEALPRAAPPRSWQVGVDGALALGIGFLPEPSLGARASVFLQLGGGMRIFVAGSAWSTQKSTVGAGQGATLSLASLGLGVCPLHGDWRAWTWRTCARGDVGRLRASGFGFTLSSSQDRLTADAGAAVEVQRRVLGPLFAGVAAELVVPFVRDRIAYSGSSGEVVPVFQPAPVAGVGTFRLGCAF